MENAVEALKIAFGVMMFVLALSLSISCISRASSAVTAIVGMNDRETEYTYVELPEDVAMSSRIVGVETIVPTMYKAYEENFEIYFFDASGNPLALYYATDSDGEIKLDETHHKIEVNYVDLEKENFGSAESAKTHLDILLADKTQNTDPLKYNLYEKQFIYDDGLYEYLKGFQFGFVEQLGEYYQNDGENTPDAQKIKKRVITYTVYNP